MDRRFMVTALAILLVTAGSIAMASRTGLSPETTTLNETTGLRQSLSGPEEPLEASEPDYMYILREHEGRVAVFLASGPEEPAMVYDTLVKYLPDYDRVQMEAGIPIKDYQELVNRVEDYLS